VVDQHSIYPVILPVPHAKKALTGRDKVEFLSKYARKALKRSAQYRGIDLGELIKDENGAPVPTNGCHWSITHKSEYVGGVAAPYRIGFDIEKIKPFSPGLLKKTAGEEEWRLGNTDPQNLFFRYWTSKEAVLKAAGRGIGGLSTCKVSQVIDDRHLMITYDHKIWPIEHFFFENHIASIVTSDIPVRWTLLKDDPHAP
jgi:4'-phosphopantetheinyl transferase